MCLYKHYSIDDNIIIFFEKDVKLILLRKITNKIYADKISKLRKQDVDHLLILKT